MSSSFAKLASVPRQNLFGIVVEEVKGASFTRIVPGEGPDVLVTNQTVFMCRTFDTNKLFFIAEKHFASQSEEMITAEYCLSELLVRDNNNKLHRDDGPAHIDLTNRLYRWYQHGKLHRDGGPAEDHFNGHLKIWYQHGKYHREDGPAIVRSDGARFWYLNGEELTEAEHAQRCKK